jgi:cephalosporin-C deacetylase-like acetyl esterase
MFRSLCGVLLAGFACSVASADEQVSSTALAKNILQLDGRVILRGTLRRNPMTTMLARHVAAELREANRRDRSTWNAVKTKADWKQLRDRRLKALRTSLGQFPDVPNNLKVRVVRTTKGDGFHVDNLVFESRPGVVVTANLYRPAKPSSSMPGLIICHSHIRPKETGARQLMGATWARTGCIVLVPDHLGHGERRQHPFRALSDYAKPFSVSSQDYYFRYDAGIQLHLIGDSLMGWLAWDLWRGVDVLLDQPGVDPKRIVMISEPAGGGDVAAVAAGLDNRITGVMVNNFGGPEPENGYPLPADAESWFPYTASGSWESTRNLRLSARDGFLPWQIVASVAPRRLIYYHEFYWDREQDPVWKRLQKIYGFHAAANSLVGMAGHGFVVGSSPENTHWTPYSRALLYPTLERWFGIPNPKKEHDTLIPEKQLLCLTSAAAKRYQPVPLHHLCSRIGSTRAEATRNALAKLSQAERSTRLRKRWEELLGGVRPASNPFVRKHDEEKLAGITVERIQLGTEPGIIVPVLLLVPKSDLPRRVVVGVAQSGKQSFLRKRSQQIAELLEAGTAVCLPDLRGTGETDPGDGRGRRSAATTLSSSELMLGQTFVGARLHDLRQVIRYLRQRDDVNEKRVVLWGDSFALANPINCNFAVPRGISDRPHLSEPLGGLLALLAVLFDEKIEAVSVHGGLTGFHDALASPFCYLPHDVVIPGVLTAGDLCDLVAAIAPRPLRLDGLVDGANRRSSVENSRKQYAIAITAYRHAHAEKRFVITNGDLRILQWLLRTDAAAR